MTEGARVDGDQRTPRDHGPFGFGTPSHPAAQCKAGDQTIILEQSKASNGSDSYSYRYLAKEGFLPGL